MLHAEKRNGSGLACKATTHSHLREDSEAQMVIYMTENHGIAAAWSGRRRKGLL